MEHAIDVEPFTHAEYTSATVLDEELKRLFFQRWLYVCHASELHTAGAYRRFDLGQHSVVVLRDRQGRIRAFHNTCRHRGARLFDEEAGICRRAISCRYHGWTYGLDGQLTAAPKMPPGLDKEALSLLSPAVEVWNGLVFVCLEGEPEPVAAQLAEADLSAYGLADTKVAFEHRKVLSANWKIPWENGLECYHCAINHPDLKRVADIERNGIPPTMIQTAELNFNRAFPVFGRSVTRSGNLECAVRLGPGPQYPETVGFLSWHLSAFELVASPDHAHLMTYLPMDTGHTLMRTVGLVHQGAQEGVDYVTEDLYAIHRTTREQDDGLCELVHAGVTSPAFTPGPFNPLYEFENTQFVRLYREAMS